MSNNSEFNSDLEAILAEFSSYSSSISGNEEQPASVPKSSNSSAPKAAAPVTGAEDDNAQYYIDMTPLENIISARKKAQEASGAPTAPRTTPREKREAADYAPAFRPEGKSYQPPKVWAKPTAVTRRNAPKPPNAEKYFNEDDKKHFSALQQKAEEKQQKLDAQKSALRKAEKDEKKAHETVHAQRQRTQTPLKKALVALFTAMTLLTFCWIAVNIHPDSGTTTSFKAQNNLNLTSKLDVYINNAASDALGDLTYIKKIYKIAETDTVAPKPNAANFGTTTDPAVIEAIIAQSGELLDGQETVWQPDLPFYPGEETQYYRDDTILVIVWKEIIEERCATLAEVKIADGSQFRRKLTEDTYGSSVQLYASELAAAANAVVAANADFYAYRQIGLTVYQRQLFRNQPEKLDTCFITAGGDMLFSRAGELTSDAQVQQYIADNDVVFTLSFGPVLVENGVAQQCDGYPIGEMNMEYSRSGIGMTDELHYLLMTVNHTDMRPRANVNEFARFMAAKGCVKAYNLDGGQTSEIVFQGEAVNHVDFGAERTVSDIIYFASAIPESEVAG